MIDICRVTKRYGTSVAVREVSLTVAAGQTMVLIGPSGSGKTTLLKMINRMVDFDEGSIRVNGQDIAGVDPVSLRRGIGYVIQQIGLLPHFSVSDNISFVLRLLGPGVKVAHPLPHDGFHQFGGRGVGGAALPDLSAVAHDHAAIRDGENLVQAV